MCWAAGTETDVEDVFVSRDSDDVEHVIPR